MAGEKTLAALHWQSLVENNDFVQADKFFQKMKKTQQLDVEVCRVMGLWYRQMQQYGQSADAFVQGLVLRPNHSELYYELANTMRESGNDESAVRYYQLCLSLQPAYIDAWFCLGETLAALEQTEAAAEAFCKAMALTTSVPEIIALAVAFSELGLVDQAIHSYFYAMLLEPDNCYLYSNLGVELAELGAFADAVFCHEKALKMAPEDADVWYNSACTYTLMGETMRAFLALEKAIQLNDANRDYALQDPELESLQKHKRFWKLVRENVDIENE